MITAALAEHGLIDVFPRRFIWCFYILRLEPAQKLSTMLQATVGQRLQDQRLFNRDREAMAQHLYQRRAGDWLTGDIDQRGVE